MNKHDLFNIGINSIDVDVLLDGDISPDQNLRRHESQVQFISRYAIGAAVKIGSTVHPSWGGKLEENRNCSRQIVDIHVFECGK